MTGTGDDMLSYSGMVEYEPNVDRKDYGIKRKSGRYPWGSGEDEYGRSMAFYDYINGMKAKGLSDKEIAVGIGEDVRKITGNDRDSYSISDLRSTRTIAKEAIVLAETNRAVALRDKGTSIKAIAEEMGLPQPTVRLRLKNSENMKQSALTQTADILRKNVDEHKIVDIGKGTELHIDTGVKMGISPEKLKAATGILRDEGYETYTLQVRNVGTKNFTNQKVIVPPGTGYGTARRMADKIHTIAEWTENDGLTYFGIREPKNVSSKRLKIVYDEEGGSLQDGVIYVRPGAKDLDMGKNTYAQVRIAVDGTHYIKGMAVKKEDMPAGVDLMFHTNKKRSEIGSNKLDALKPMVRDKDGNIDKDNPFGSMIKRQILETDPATGVERAKSALNFVNEEGDWNWRESLPSQMLAKQPHSLIKSQLATTREQTKARLDEINKITNPVVKKKALEDFADQVDADAVDLRAAAMPRQRTQVIIPMPKMNKGEIYAPNFETGERVVLIRYPHGGRFEIPEVTVNNNNRTAKKLLGNAVDAIGIHPAVAERLSGADFDGDTVVVIPNRTGKIKGSESMGSQARIYETELNNFEPKRKYGGFVQTGTDKDGNPIGNFPLMRNTGKEMGVITNLVTDMSIQGAKPEHIVRAVKHSMVVIDAEKHKLNYKQSEIDNNISQLRSLYQTTTKPDGSVKVGGASTLLSKATAETRIPDRKLRPAKEGGPIDPDTGARVYVPTGKTRSKYDPKTQTYLDEKVPVETKVKRLDLTDDANTLVRDKADPVERLYADHANEMKALANSARLTSARTNVGKTNTDPRAKAVYKDDVDKLVADLNAAKKQKPLDRKADVIANATVKMKRQEDPLLRTDSDRLKKVERQAKAAARARMGLEKPVIPISDSQWDAIQAGVVSPSRLREILEYADPVRVAELSMPRKNTVMTSAITARAKAMLSAGATNADVAAALGISVSTLRAAALRGDV